MHDAGAITARYDVMAGARSTFRECGADLRDIGAALGDAVVQVEFAAGQFAEVLGSGSGPFSIAWDAALSALDDACALVAGNIEATQVNFEAVDRGAVIVL